MGFALPKMTLEDAMVYHQVSLLHITSDLFGMRCDGCGRQFNVGEVVLWGDTDDWYCNEDCFATTHRDELLDD